MARVQTRKPKDKALPKSFALDDIGFDSDDFARGQTIGTTEMESKTIGTTEMESKTIGTTEMESKTIGTTEMESKTVGTTGMESKTVGTTGMESKTVGTTEMESKTIGTTEMESKTIGTTEMESKTIGTTEMESKTIGTTEMESKTVSTSRIKQLERELEELRKKTKLSKNAQRIVAAIKSEALIQKTDEPIIGYKKLTRRGVDGYSVHPNYFRKALIELESKEIIKRTEISYSGKVRTNQWRILENL